MRLIRFGWFYLGKMWKNMEKRPFFRADMAGLGKYCTGGYGRIGVYRGIRGSRGSHSGIHFHINLHDVIEKLICILTFVEKMI